MPTIAGGGYTFMNEEFPKKATYRIACAEEI